MIRHPQVFWLKVPLDAASCAMVPPSPTEVTAGTSFCNRHRIPDLGLLDKPEYDDRVYALACEGGRVYVGIANKKWVGRRISGHFNGEGAFFTKEYRPREILLVFPAASTAVEAYVYFALLAQYSASSVFRLGGWTQTGTVLNPLTSMMVERDRRLLTNRCFKCGGGHWAKDCSAEPEGCDYKCGHCKAAVRITNAGASLTSQPVASGRSIGGLAVVDPGPSSGGVKRRAEVAPRSSVSAKVARAAAPRGACLRVVACGVEYTTLAWYLRKSEVTPRERSLAARSCSQRRLELQGGDTKTLQSRGFVSASSPLELLPGRQRLLSTWMETACRSLKDGVPAKLRSPGGDASGGRQILWRLCDLQVVFPSSAAAGPEA